MSSEDTKVVAVIPTFDPLRTSLVQDLVATLSVNGVLSRVVANSKAAYDLLVNSDTPVLTVGRNMGFGETIAKGLEGVAEWDWLIILNDDVSLDVANFSEAIDSLGEMQPLVGIVYLDPEEERQIPNLLDVFLNVSLMGSLVPRRRIGHLGTFTYKSFSAVAIRRRCWDALKGFDPHLPFTYEDSDFARRARDAGIAYRSLANAGVTHEGSSTTSKHIAEVLPVGVWSAAAYSRKWSHLPHLVRPLLLVALAVRVLAAPMSKAPLRHHYLGIARAMRVVIRNAPRALPAYATRLPR